MNKNGKIEIHPFKDFIPKKIEYLLIGSFTSKDSKKGTNYDWYYCNGRNHFWALIEKVYNVELPSTEEKKSLFSNLRIGVTDMIKKCRRKTNSSLDNALEVLEYNSSIPKILSNNLNKVFFSSRFVEKNFYKVFGAEADKYPHTEFIYLPSPSPRYASMSKDEKVNIYRKNLPSMAA